MDAIPLALDGYLTDPVTGQDTGTASWRLTCSPTDHLVDDATIPCTSQHPHVVTALHTECRPGDLLRVTGHLVLPDNAGQGLRFEADAVEILWEAPALPDDVEPDASAPDTGRAAAIAALAESLTSLAGPPGPDTTIRIHISPTGALGTGLDHCHSLDISPQRAHQLADQVDAMNCYMDSARADTVLDAETVADLTDLFDGIDVLDLTAAVLTTTRPEHRLQVTQAIDDMFGDRPIPGIDDSDQ